MERSIHVSLSSHPIIISNIYSRRAYSSRARDLASLSRTEFELVCTLQIDLGSGMLSNELDHPAWGGRLAWARLVDSPPPQGSGLQVHLCFFPFPFSLTLSSLGLPSLAATTGRAAAPSVTPSPSPLPAKSFHQVCLPLLFPPAVRGGAPQTLTKLFVFGSDPLIVCHLLTSFSFAKIIACQMLGSPLLGMDARVKIRWREHILCE